MFSAAEFFKDSPWLQIPQNRRGEILVEPLYPKGGLLGGSSSTSGPKVSKLAALAAARKKKENNHPSSGGSQSLTSSVALLDRLGGRTSATKTSDESTSKSKVSSSIDAKPEPSAKLRDREYPTRRRDSSSQSALAKTTVSDVQPSENISVKPEVSMVDITIPTASPSDFAKTMFRPSEKSRSEFFLSESSTFSIPFDYASSTESNPFAGPSPDDVVIKAQTSKGSTRKNREV